MGAVHKLAAAITPGGRPRGWGIPPGVWGAPGLGFCWLLVADPADAGRGVRGVLSRGSVVCLRWSRGKAGREAGAQAAEAEAAVPSALPGAAGGGGGVHPGAVDRGRVAGAYPGRIARGGYPG